MKVKKLVYCLLMLALVSMVLGGCGSSAVSNSNQEQSTAQLSAASEEFPNAMLLISASSLQASLGAKNFIIIDARTADAYTTAHIPGAINVQHGAYWTMGSGLKPLTTLESQLGEVGITRDAKIVIYDNTTASWGAAGRIFWMLEYLGCTDVHILNGGWDKWSADGRPTQTTIITLPAATFTAKVDSSKIADSDHIASRLYDQDFAVIDSRTDEEYVGWILYGEAQGGHIPRAVQLPYAWFFNSDKTTASYQALTQLLESRGITPYKEVAAYCTAGIRSGYVYFLLRLMGYPRASNYDASIADWAAQSLPEESAPNFASLVYPAWVKALIDYHKPGSTSSAPPQYPYNRSHKYLIFETQWGSLDDMAQQPPQADDAYLKGHIPGAIHSNSDTYENGFPRWFLLPDVELITALGSMGITKDTTVVVYSDSNIFAARLWWILSYAGVQDVRILNGGYQAWIDAGYNGETTINNPVATTYDGTPNPAVIATTDYVFNNYQNTATTQLIDVRSGSEYVGNISGYNYVVQKGRIPNAIWAYDGDDSSPAYRDSDGTFRSYTEVKDMWRSVGISFDKEMVFYCGSGYRSSVTFFYGYLMGMTNIRNYSNGWEDWSTNYVEDPTYVKDPNIPGSTTGWRQLPSGRPVATGWPML